MYRLCKCKLTMCKRCSKSSRCVHTNDANTHTCVGGRQWVGMLPLGTCAGIGAHAQARGKTSATGNVKCTGGTTAWVLRMTWVRRAGRSQYAMTLL